MKNSIIDIYIDWLENYAKHCTDPDMRDLSKHFIGALSSIDTLVSLVTALKVYIGENKTSGKQLRPGFFTADNFYQQLGKWLARQQLSLIHFESAKNKLKNLPASPLSRLLESLMNSPSAFLHTKTSDFIDKLYQVDLLQLIKDLERIPAADNPPDSTPGSFTKVAAIHKDLEDLNACTTLLNNLSQSPESFDNRELANGLLQAMLYIYIDINCIDINPPQQTGIQYRLF